jgi:hypothetical protein
VSSTPRRIRKPALIVALIAIVGLGAASAMATLAASAVKPFELVVNGVYEPDDDGAWQAKGSFTSQAPFCESGSAEDVGFGARFTCADGGGSITLYTGSPLFRHALEARDALEGDGDSSSDWRIVAGSRQYSDLRGKGPYSKGVWAGDKDTRVTFRRTFQGVAAADVVAPTIALASAQASKVAGKKGVYTIAAALDLRDNVEDNPVSYTVSVRRENGAGPWLASKVGEATGSISFEFRVRRPNGRVRAVLIRTTAVDPVGNESSLDATVKLPK